MGRITHNIHFLVAKFPFRHVVSSVDGRGSLTNSSRRTATGKTMQQDEHDADATANDDRLHTIGEMARTYGVTLRALRFYEDRGLLKPLRDGTTRYYDAKARARLELILKGKTLGFT